MGLTAIVQGTGPGDWLARFSATYESYGALQDMVSLLFEKGHPGSKFPLYMRGRPGREELRYTSSEAGGLRGELLEIRDLLSDRRVPGVRLVMGLEESVKPIRMDRAGKVLPVYEDDQWELGCVSGRMLFLRSLDDGTEMRSGSFRRVAGESFLKEDGGPISSSLLALGDLWEAVETNVDSTYGYILDGMINLCEASLASGNPVQLS
jgi:hypothetical protein